MVISYALNINACHAIIVLFCARNVRQTFSLVRCDAKISRVWFDSWHTCLFVHMLCDIVVA